MLRIWLCFVSLATGATSEIGDALCAALYQTFVADVGSVIEDVVISLVADETLSERVTSYTV